MPKLFLQKHLCASSIGDRITVHLGLGGREQSRHEDCTLVVWPRIQRVEENRGLGFPAGQNLSAPRPMLAHSIRLCLWQQWKDHYQGARRSGARCTIPCTQDPGK